MVTPIYMMPGMAASPAIFEKISLDETRFKLISLRWKVPQKEETLTHYASRMLEDVRHKDPVLLGVSFGGVLVQEMAKQIPHKKLIIVSSIKSRDEMPRKMRVTARLKLYNMAPVRIVKTLDKWPKYAPSDKLRYKVSLYQKYLSVNDPRYLSWAIKQMVCWDQKVPPKNIVHIHGDADPVFPFRYIKDCIRIKGGTHIMIITKFNWFNKHLPDMIDN